MLRYSRFGFSFFRSSMDKYVTVGNKKLKTDHGTDRNERYYKEVKGNLFTSPPNESLAHCISRDVRMGKGIAVHFRNKYGGVQELKDQGKKVGEVAVLQRDQRYVYYLITKEAAWHKPTYSTLMQSLQAMKTHALQHNVEGISMPRIGCGLDGLDWEEVMRMVKDVFGGSGINITVYVL